MSATPVGFHPGVMHGHLFRHAMALTGNGTGKGRVGMRYHAGIVDFNTRHPVRLTRPGGTDKPRQGRAVGGDTAIA